MLDVLSAFKHRTDPPSERGPASVDEIRRRVISDLVDLDIRHAQPLPRRRRLAGLRRRSS